MSKINNFFLFSNMFNFDEDIENNHTEESIEYYQNKNNNLTKWTGRIINFLKNTLTPNNLQSNVNTTNNTTKYLNNDNLP
jgi:hypothetical protein